MLLRGMNRYPRKVSHRDHNSVRQICADSVTTLRQADFTRTGSEAFVRGACGYLLTTYASSEIVLAVRAALRGKTYLSRDDIDVLRWQHKKSVDEYERLTGCQRLSSQIERNKVNPGTTTSSAELSVTTPVKLAITFLT